MKKLTILVASIALLGLGACSDDADGGDDIDAAAPDIDAADVGPPAMPAVGAVQIDRAGRPAISTALQETFNGDMVARGAAKDAYNADADPSMWGDSYTPGFMGSMAILDSLDTDCGNQLGADLDPNSRYSALAALLADDVLHVNSASGTCGGVYLAVEANALNIIPNDDCGGRTLAADVVDVSYSVLAAGDLTFSIGDAVDANDVAFNPDFPYLADPHAP